MRYGGSSQRGAFAYLPRDWALRIDSSGLFRLEEQHDTLDSVGADAQEHQQHDETLLEWASRWESEASSATNDGAGSSPNEASAFLVVGAKTSVLHGFGHRQAIRQTWASTKATPAEVRVVFLGCEPDLSLYSASVRQELQRAIALEKRVFGDLLTTELLQCQDSFAYLADKVKAYMQWVDEEYPMLAYAMVVDDDVYLRLDLLLELLHTTPRTRFFGGNSASSDYRDLGVPIRDPRNKYYITQSTYPRSHYPPYLSGGHVILSRDAVAFIARNSKILRGFGALDDTTLGVWLSSFLQIKPTYFDAFQNLRYLVACHEELISLADLSTVAVQQIHANLRSNHSLCDDFEFQSWVKPTRTMLLSNDLNANNDAFDTGRPHWAPHFDTELKTFQIKIAITVAGLSVTFVYTPSLETVGVGFCGRASRLLQQKLYLTVGDTWCFYHQQILLAALNKTASEQPGMRAMLWQRFKERV